MTVTFKVMMMELEIDGILAVANLPPNKAIIGVIQHLRHIS